MCPNKGNVGHPRGDSWRNYKCGKSNETCLDSRVWVVHNAIGERIADVQKIFTHIVNNFIGHENIF